MKRYAIILPLILSVISCSKGMVGLHADDKMGSHQFPKSFPLYQIVQDRTPPFTINPTKPFKIEFGKKMRWDGMDTITIENEHVTLYRLQLNELCYPCWETATMQLLPDDVKTLIKSLEQFQILKMSKAYHANVSEGTQWILLIQQGNYEKSIYFDNHFPDNIFAFSRFLDDLLVKRGFLDFTWQAIPENEPKNHENELWESLKR